MVFSQILYHLRSLLCGSSCATPDLVAATNDSGMEDRTHGGNSSSQFDTVPGNYGIDSYDQGVLQVN